MAARNALTRPQKFSQPAVSRPFLQSRQPVPISSHPDADPETPVTQDAAIDERGDGEFRRGPDAERIKPIVSINGSDVKEEADCDAA